MCHLVSINHTRGHNGKMKLMARIITLSEGLGFESRFLIRPGWVCSQGKLPTHSQPVLSLILNSVSLLYPKNT